MIKIRSIFLFCFIIVLSISFFALTKANSELTPEDEQYLQNQMDELFQPYTTVLQFDKRTYYGCNAYAALCAAIHGYY